MMNFIFTNYTYGTSSFKMFIILAKVYPRISFLVFDKKVLYDCL